MRTATILVALALAVPAAEAAQRARYLMGTVCEVAAGSESQIESAFAEAKRVELMLSNWIADSELSRVNRGAAPGEELRALLALAAEWTRKTNRAFDPQYEKSTYDSGAFGKGYALDRMLALTTGDAMIDFGGQIIVRGEREVAIADPSDRGKPVVAMTITNASLSTSANAEKPGHIIDPRTGNAVMSRGSVSVIADDALTADILSTALFVMGEDAVFVTPTQHVRLSAKARERVRGLSLLDRNFQMKD
jgi:thiamine biosynthesis lipoprotein